MHKYSCMMPLILTCEPSSFTFVSITSVMLLPLSRISMSSFSGEKTRTIDSFMVAAGVKSKGTYKQKVLHNVRCRKVWEREREGKRWCIWEISINGAVQEGSIFSSSFLRMRKQWLWKTEYCHSQSKISERSGLTTVQALWTCNLGHFLYSFLQCWRTLE